MKEMYLNT